MNMSMIYQVYMYMDRWMDMYSYKHTAHIVLENTFIILHLRIKELNFSLKSHVGLLW